MIARVLLAAVIAGMIAGAAATAMQMWRVTPLILQAEHYESAQPGHSHGKSTLEFPAIPAEHGTYASDPNEPWAPRDGFERAAYTLASNLVMGVAFALLLAAAAMFTGRGITHANGVLWGLAGFAAFTLAPAFGLSPELPGMPAAELVPRQAWWWGTALATAAGIALIALQPRMALKALGAGLIVLPHIIGAPRPDAHDSAVPAALAAEFAANSLAVMALFWVILGVALGWTFSHSGAVAQRGEPR